jgi:hypothetical protein
MADPPSKSLDVLGIKPVGDAVNAVTEGVVKGASAFLSRICLPACEEFGLLLRDKVSAWRARNAVQITQRAERKLNESGAGDVHAHPRLVGQILEQGSWSDDETVQELWAGLMASSCDAEGRDDSNMMFVDLLSRLSVSQVRILNYACQNAVKRVSAAGWLTADELSLSLEKLKEISGVSDFHRLDRELDHLRTFGLFPDLGGGFSPHSTFAGITPSSLALHMFARCNGYRGDPPSFYTLTANPDPEVPSSQR